MLVLLSGCVLKQTELNVQLPGNIPPNWTTEVAPEELPVTADLLTLIKSAPLKELVREAMANNPDLKNTALRLKAAGYMLSEPRSRQLPRINAGFSKGRNNQNLNGETGRELTSNSHQLSLGISWELDIWGRLADEYTASNQAVLARKFEYLHARDALAARIIETWIEQVAIRRSLSIEKERLKVLEHIEKVLVERYRNGIGNLDELSTAKTRTEIARADLSAGNSALLRAVRTLEVLVGRYPRGELLSSNTLPEVLPPPAGIPATVLVNRPDVQGGLAQLASARALSSAAKKARLPDLTLSGQIFKESTRLNHLSGASTYWNVLGSLFQPLFEGGRLMDASKARRTEADASLMELHHIILHALKEVEDAFDLEHDLAMQARALEIAVQESKKSSQYYTERYRQGLDTIQSLLIAKEQEISVRIRLSEVKANRLRNRINLALALGVGLEDKHDDALHKQNTMNSNYRKKQS